MPKANKSARRKVKTVNNLTLFSNITGLGSDSTSDSLEKCLEAFNRTQQSQSEEPSNTETQPSVGETPNTIGWISAVAGRNRLESNEIESWNQSFLCWIQGGSYIPDMLPNIEQEIARNFAVRELSSFLLQAGSDIRMPMFERWLLDSRLEETNSSRLLSDPILPREATLQSKASQRLVQELRDPIKDGEKAKRVVSDLCQKTNVKSKELIARNELYRRQSPLKKGDRITVEKLKASANVPAMNTIVYAKKKWKKPFCYRVNAEHYEKLRVRFFDIHETATKTKLDDKDERILRAFNILVLSLLVRYSAMSGGFLNDDLRGGGMQGAIHTEVFSVLRKHFPSCFVMEGFASPLNHCLESFCSAFPDVEWHFGSMGSFMHSRFTHDTCCELNPPFAPGLMLKMSLLILHALKAAAKAGRNLTFIVVVPTASDNCTVKVKHSANDSYQRMVTSPHCKMQIVLPSRAHGYIEGAQHLRPTRYKESNYDTSVILLQSRDSTLLDFTQLEGDIRASFASRHRQETRMRKSLN